jgi:hypothetical protein
VILPITSSCDKVYHNYYDNITKITTTYGIFFGFNSLQNDIYQYSRQDLSRNVVTTTVGPTTTPVPPPSNIINDTLFIQDEYNSDYWLNSNYKYSCVFAKNSIFDNNNCSFRNILDAQQYCEKDQTCSGFLFDKNTGISYCTQISPVNTTGKNTIFYQKIYNSPYKNIIQTMPEYKNTKNLVFNGTFIYGTIGWNGDFKNSGNYPFPIISTQPPRILPPTTTAKPVTMPPSNQYTTIPGVMPSSDLENPIMGTLPECKTRCNNDPKCIGFSREIASSDYVNKQCYLKQSSPGIVNNDAKWNTFSKTDRLSSWIVTNRSRSLSQVSTSVPDVFSSV